MSARLDEHGISVVAGAASGSDALTRVVESRPDLVFIDIDLGGENGLALTRRLGEPGLLGLMSIEERDSRQDASVVIICLGQS